MTSDPDEFHNQDDFDDVPESKSQRKRNAHQITRLAGELVEMKPRVLAALPIEPSIREAITQCAQIKAHGARKRQLHFVSKLLREAANINELQAMVENPDLQKKRKSGTNPHLDFRDRLIDNFADLVDDLKVNYPNADLQRVRQLVRNAHSECKKITDNKKVTEQNHPQHEADFTPKPHNTKAAKSLLKLLAGSS